MNRIKRSCKGFFDGNHSCYGNWGSGRKNQQNPIKPNQEKPHKKRHRPARTDLRERGSESGGVSHLISRYSFEESAIQRIQQERGRGQTGHMCKILLPGKNCLAVSPCIRAKLLQIRRAALSCLVRKAAGRRALRDSAAGALRSMPTATNATRAAT